MVHEEVLQRQRAWQRYGQPFLGRLPAEDDRDLAHPMRAVVARAMRQPDETSEQALERGWRYWNALGWWGDQGSAPHCVAFAWVHYLEDGPVTSPSTPHYQVGGDPVVDTTWLYNAAQRNDEWEGENYDGTSVRAGAKVLTRQGKVQEYLWAHDVDTVVDAVLAKAPVVVGTDWTSDMFKPDDNGFITPTGNTAGGHAYLINGVNRKEEKVRFKNSWGRRWGVDGHGWMTFESLDTLMKRWGEACMAVQAQEQ